MGSPSASTGGGERRYEPPKKKNPIVEFVKGGGIIGAAVKGIKKSAKKSKAKKQANVEVGLGKDRMSNYSVGQGGTRQERDNSSSNKVVTAPKTTIAQVPKTTIAQVPKTTMVQSPTTAEVSQSATAEVSQSATAESKEEDDILLRKRRNKAKGRSPTILTGVTGVTGGLTLGKPSLLGR